MSRTAWTATLKRSDAVLADDPDEWQLTWVRNGHVHQVPCGDGQAALRWDLVEQMVEENDLVIEDVTFLHQGVWQVHLEQAPEKPITPDRIHKGRFGRNLDGKWVAVLRDTMDSQDICTIKVWPKRLRPDPYDLQVALVRQGWSLVPDIVPMGWDTKQESRRRPPVTLDTGWFLAYQPTKREQS